jgi:hypothetical protein
LFIVNPFSDEYEDVKNQSRQILLKYKASRIADYEALNQIHLVPNPEPQPKYIYYLGQPGSYENWNNARKDNVNSVIYDDDSKKPSKFKVKDYDQHSILEYVNIYEHIIRMSTEKLKNDFSNNIENLIENFKDTKSIDIIEDVKNKLEYEFGKFQLKIKRIEES